MSKLTSVPLSNGKLTYWLLGILAAIAMTVSGAYINNLSSKVSELDGEQSQVRERLVRLETKVDQILIILKEVNGKE